MADVLIVDDQPYLRELFSEMLVEAGYGVESVAYAESLMEHLKRFHPDVVLLDFYVDGFHAADVLHEIKGWDPQMPVIVVTARENFVDEFMFSRIERYVLKSFSDLTALKRKIADILVHKHVAYQ